MKETRWVICWEHLAVIECDYSVSVITAEHKCPVTHRGVKASCSPGAAVRLVFRLIAG